MESWVGRGRVSYCCTHRGARDATGFRGPVPARAEPVAISHAGSTRRSVVAAGCARLLPVDDSPSAKGENAAGRTPSDFQEVAARWCRLLPGWVRGLEPPTFRSTGDGKHPPRSQKSSRIIGILRSPVRFASGCERYSAEARTCGIPREKQGSASVARKMRGSLLRNGMALSTSRHSRLPTCSRGIALCRAYAARWCVGTGKAGQCLPRPADLPSACPAPVFSFPPRAEQLPPLRPSPPSQRRRPSAACPAGATTFLTSHATAARLMACTSTQAWR
jgi:hypothetical protein